MELILSQADGTECCEILDADYDFDIGDLNDFRITFSRSNWRNDVDETSRIYIPDTEYGGLAKRLGTDTEEDEVTAGGYTWRGMMANKIIRPAAGADYRIVSGDLNTIIKNMVETEFPNLFYGSEIPTGITVSNYRFKRYCTLLSGLHDLLSSYNYKLKIRYVQTQPAGYVEVSAVPIIDWSGDIELSEDCRLDYTCDIRKDGVNHLICLGQGELKNRVVVDLYVDQNGQIGTTQYYKGIDEIVDTYDSPGATGEELVDGGTKRLKELMNSSEFKMDIATLDMAVNIGDIIGGRDYLTGMYARSAITGVIYTCKEGVENREYKVGSTASVNSRETSEASSDAVVVYGDYNALSNKPSIEGVPLINNKTFAQLGLNSISNQEIDEILYGGQT